MYMKLSKTSLQTKIEKEFGEIICEFPILHYEWEMDCNGFVVEKDGERNVVLTEHGKPYISSVKILNDKISEYKSIIQQTERCIFLLKR